MLKYIVMVSFVFNSIHLVSCILMIAIIYKTNRFAELQEQLLALQILAEVLYETIHIINVIYILLDSKPASTAEHIMEILDMICLSLSFQILAFLAAMSTASITCAVKYKLFVTKDRVVKLFVSLLLLDVFVGSLSLIPGTQIPGYIVHSQNEEEETRANANVSVRSIAVNVFRICFQLLPPLACQLASFYSVSKFARLQTLAFVSRRVLELMRNVKFILVVCIFINISYLPHKVIDCVLLFNHEQQFTHIVATVSNYLPVIYSISKFPIFLIYCKAYRMTVLSLICRRKNRPRIHPSTQTS